MNNRIRRKASVQLRLQRLDGMSLRTIAAAVCGALGLGLTSQALAAGPGSTLLTNSSAHGLSTPSTIGTSAPNIWNVTAKTSSGNTAFNSFDNFNVAHGDTVNLYRPTGTTNLVNLVWSAAAQIYGTVNSYTYTGSQLTPQAASSGAVYFADPYGIVVGKGGVLNVGALSLSAPTETFMESLLDSNGNPVAANVTTLLQGAEPVNEGTANACADGNSAMICVDGTISATNAVRIHATTIDVSGTISVAGNGTDTLATAVNTGTETDGNTIRLIADDSNSSDTGGGDSQAAGSVTVSGTLSTGNVTYANSQTTNPSSKDSWGEIALTASASASSTYSDPTKTAAVKSTGDLLLDQATFFASDPSAIENDAGTLQTDVNLATSDKVGELAYVRAFGTANVELQSGANLSAYGNVVLQSSTTTSATTSATATQSSGSIPVMVTGMYGAVDSKASALIDAGATVSSTNGDVTVASNTNNTLNVAANTIAADNKSVVGATVAWSQAAVNADAEVNGSVTAQNLNIGALNTNSFATNASAQTSNSASAGSIGLAGAVSEQTVQAKAYLGDAPSMTGGTGNGNITIAAETDTTQNQTVASTGTTAATGNSASGAADNSGDNADLTSSMGNVTGDADGSGSGKGLGSKLPFKIGSAVAWTDSSNNASATTASNLTLTTPGNLAVQAIVSNAGIHNSASSETSSEEDSGAESGGSSSGTNATVSAAVAYGNYQNSADAEIGSGDNITALNIGVNSQVVVPFDWTFGQSDLDASSLSALTSMGQSLDDFEQGAEELKNLVQTAKAAPDEIMGGVSSYAGAFGDGSNVAIGGSVNYFGMTNNSRAWVGSGSTLTSTATSAPGNESWTSTLNWLSGAVNGDNLAVSTSSTDNTSTFTWGKSISVLAATNVATFNLVGDLTPWSATTSGDDAAIGGAFNYGGYADTTTAGVDAGVALTSNNTVSVNATGADTLFVLSPISGKGGSAAMVGMVALTDVSDQTHATLSGSDNVNAAALDVNATNPLMVWSLTGALAMSTGTGIGISVGINDVTTNTLALIGDNSADEVTGTPGTPAESGGTISVGALNMQADSSGEAGALSVAGSSVTSPSPSPAPTPTPAPSPTPAPAPGSSLISMLSSASSVADSLRSGDDKFQSALAEVDELTGGNVSNSDVGNAASSTGSLLDKASSALSAASSGATGLQSVVGKLSSLGGSSSSPSPSPSPSNASFGIAISGAASVNMATLNTQTELDGVTVKNQSGKTSANTAAVVALNNAELYSAAGSAALNRAKSTSGSGDLAGAVAYSNVGDTTSATIGDSGTSNDTKITASDVTVQALDNSQQIDAGVGVVGQLGGSGTSVTVAGSVSIGQSQNQTVASIGDSTVNGGSAGNNVQVTAYDASAIGIGAGSFALNTSTGDSGNGALSLTYANINDDTSATVSSTTVSQYNGFSLNALDGSEIVAAAATGSVSTSNSSNSLTGAIIVDNVGNSTTATINGASSIQTSGDVTVQAQAVSTSSADVQALDLPVNAPASSYYDFSGSTLAYNGSGASNSNSIDASQPNASSLQDAGWGSSIIAVAGDITASGNNVGLSFVDSTIGTTHDVSIDNATINSGSALNLQAADSARIISVAVGGGLATGSFAGVGSATYNSIHNNDSILLGSASDATNVTSLTASSINATAQDSSSIYSLAGSVAIGTDGSALGGAFTYNDIADTIQSEALKTSLTSTGDTSVLANNNAMIMSGAVAGGGAANVGLDVSFSWNQIGSNGNDATTAAIADGSAVNAANLNVKANNQSTIDSLSGGVAIGGDAAVGLAVSVNEDDDNTYATLQDSAIGLSGTATTQAINASNVYALAVAGSAAGDGAVSGSATYSTVNTTTSALVNGIYGLTSNSSPAVANALDVDAENNASISSLSGGVAGSGSVAAGVATSISTIGDNNSSGHCLDWAGNSTSVCGTSATLENATLNIADTTTVNASSQSTIKSLSIGAAVGGDVGVAGSNTTNLISNSINATMQNIASDPAMDSSGAAISNQNVTSVTANNGTTIDSLAGSIGGGGAAAAGAAVAVNDIGTTTQAAFLGGSSDPLYKTQQLTVSATSGSSNAITGGSSSSPNINTIAAGAAISGDGALSGSVAVNVLDGSTTASIGSGASATNPSLTVIANGNVGVTASNNQGIDVLAGAASLSGGVSVGLGAVVNTMSGTTSAGIYNSSVSAYGNNAALSVDSGTTTVAYAPTLSSSLDNPSSLVTPNLSDTTTQVYGVAVNASNKQSISTLGVGASVGEVGLGAMAGVNTVGGATTATISQSQINQADLDTSDSDGVYTQANADQQVDVRANSNQFEANFTGQIAAGSVAGAAAASINVFSANTNATITGSTVSSQADTAVAATGNQWSLQAGIGAAASGSVAVAGAAVVNVMSAQTQALVSGGALQVGNLSVLATNNTSSDQFGGVGAISSSAAIGGVGLVDVDEVQDTASVQNVSQLVVNGTLNVNATTSNTAQADNVAAAIALNPEEGFGLAGEAIVNVLGNQTQAYVAGSGVYASTLNVSANDTQNVTADSGAVAVGADAGIGGALNLTLLQTGVDAYVSDSTVNANSVGVTAKSTRNISSETVAAGAGGVGVGLSAGVVVAGDGNVGSNGNDLTASGQFNLNDVSTMLGQNPLQSGLGSYGINSTALAASDTNSSASSYNLNGATQAGMSGQAQSSTPVDGIQAQIDGSSITTTGQVSLSATADNGVSNTAGGLAGGVVGVGGSLAYTSLNSTVQSSIDGASTIDTQGGVSISANAGDTSGEQAASSKAFAGSVGLIGIGAAVAISDVNNTVIAKDAGALTNTSGSGAVTLNASDNSTSSAGMSSPSVSVGGLEAGAVVVQANQSSTVQALLDNNTHVSGFSSGLTLNASDNGIAVAQGEMAGGGIAGAIDTTVVQANNTANVLTSIGDLPPASPLQNYSDGVVLSNDGTLSLNATASPQAAAEASGVSVAVGASIGVTEADASISTNVSALVGDGTSLSGIPDLSVNASLGFNTNQGSVYNGILGNGGGSGTYDALASSNSGSGGVLVGVDAATASATNNASVTASVGNDVTLPSKNITIQATSPTAQYAYASGVSVGGVLAAGAADASATSTTTTTATLGNGNSSNPTVAATNGALTVSATGTDRNDAISMAGSGGVISGDGATAKTDDEATTTASIGSNLLLENLQSLNIGALHTTEYGGAANAINAAVIGGSGAYVENDATSTTSATIGSNTQVDVQDGISVQAQSVFGIDSGANSGATGGTGGLFVGEAADDETTLNASNTASAGDNVVLMAGLNSNSDENLEFVASTSGSSLGGFATLSSGGATPVTDVHTTTTTNFGNTASLGSNDTLFSYGRIELGTYTYATAAAQATGESYGASPVSATHATVNLSTTQNVSTGSNDNLTAYGEIDVIAGKDMIGAQETDLLPTAISQAYAYGVISVPTAVATVNTTSTSTLTLGTGNHITGNADIGLGSMSGDIANTADGEAHGDEFGVPFTNYDNNANTNASATTTLGDNSVVTAGAFNNITISIANPTTYGGVPQVTVSGPAASEATGMYFNSSFNPTTYLDTVTSGASSTTYGGMDNSAVGAYFIPQLNVGGGNVYLYGSSISGTNATVTANGAPSITIDNASPYYLVIPSLTVGSGISGQVFVSGGANAQSLPGIAMSSPSAAATPSITVDDSYNSEDEGTKYTPGIILGNVSNMDGGFNLTNLSGSLAEIGQVSTGSQTVYVPNGYVVVQPAANGNWYSGGDPTVDPENSWVTPFIQSVIGDPNTAAAAIAEAIYGDNLSDVTYSSGAPGTQPTGTSVQQNVVILYGSCAPYTGGSGTESALDGCSGDTGGSLLGRPMPNVPTVSLTQSGDFTASQLVTGSSYTGQAFEVNAKYIDIDGAINAGSAATWTLQTGSQLGAWITAENSSDPTGTNIPIPYVDANNNTLLSLVNGYGNSQQIAAYYNAVTGKITLDNVNASGSGAVILDGGIVSTATGSIKVNSGYGDVVVNNTTGVPLVVQDINAGSGGYGLVSITDTLQTVPGTSTPLKTWYVSQNGGAMVAYTNAPQTGESLTTFDIGGSAAAPETATGYLLANAATTTQGQGNTASTNATYNPLAGMEYQWGASTSVERGNNENVPGNHFWEADENWTWASGDGGTDGSQWTISQGTFVNPTSQNYVGLNGNDYNVTMSGSLDYFNIDVYYHGCNSHGNCHYGTSETDNSGASIWDYIYPTYGTLNMQVTQRADLPIAINFETSSADDVDINSNANVYLSGVISNTNGPTSIAVTGTNSLGTPNSIIQANDSALISTKSLSLSAQGSIGSSSAPVQVQMVHDSSPDDSPLTAVTQGGDIDININSATNAQEISAIAGNSSTGYGNINISNTGSLIGLSSVCSTCANVVGDNVTLSSSLGGVGSLATPLNVETFPVALINGAPDGGVLSVSANGDIGINDAAGNMWVGTITSSAGSVSLSAPDGGIYDSRLLTAQDTLSTKQQQQIWSNLNLTSGSGGASTVAAVTNQVNAAYTQYWQLLNVGTVDGNGNYTLNPNAITLYWPAAAAANGITNPSGVDAATQQSLTQTYVANLYQSTITTFNNYIGSGWQDETAFQAQQTSGLGFSIATGSTLYQQLTSNSTWSQSALQYTINWQALTGTAGSTPSGTTTPNISAINVALKAADGVGLLSSPVQIAYSDLENGTLSSTQQTALGLANSPGAIQLFNASGTQLSWSDPTLQSDLSYIEIAQTAPLYVSINPSSTVGGPTPGLSVKSGSSVYVSSIGDLPINSVTSQGDTQITSTGNIQGASGSSATSPAINAQGNLTLTAGSNGNISLDGGTTNALPVLFTGTLISATGANVLLDQLNGNLSLDAASASGTLALTASNGSILGAIPQAIIEGNDITLAAKGDIGEISGGNLDPLSVQVSSGGLLTATATGAVNLQSPTLDLPIDTITSGGDLTVNAVKGSLTAQVLTSDNGTVYASAGVDTNIAATQAAQDITLDAAGNLTAGVVDSTGGNVLLNAADGMNLQAVTASSGTIAANLVGQNNAVFELGANGSMRASGTIGVDSSGSLLMDAGSSISAGGAVSLTSVGDTQLGLVQSTDSTGQAIGITSSAGAISGNGAPLNVQARDGGTVALQSVNDIGSAPSPLTVDVNTLTALSTAGSIYLHALGDLTAPNVSAYGDVELAVDQALNYTLISADGAANVSAANINGGTLTAGGTAQISSTGATTVNSVTSGGDLNIVAGTDLTAATLSSGGNTTLTTTTGALKVTSSLTTTDDATLTSGTDTDINATSIGGSLTSNSGGNIDITQGTVGGTSQFNAADNLTLTTFTGGNNLTAQAGGTIDFGTVTLTNGSLQANAGGDLDVTQQLNVQQGSATLIAGGDMDLANVNTGGDLSDTAGTDLTAATLSSGGNTSLTATIGALQVTNSLTTLGNATLTSGTDTNINAMTAGGSLTSNSGGNTTITQGTVGGTSQFNAADNLTLTTFTGGNNLTAQAGGTINFGTVTLTNGSLQANAGGDLDVTQQLNVQQGNAMLIAGGDMNLANVNTGGDLNAKTAGNLQATRLTSGGTTTLNAGQAMTLGNVTSAGDLSATAGTDLTAATLSSGGNTSLTATTGALQVTNSLTILGNATLTSGTDTNINAMTAGGSLTSNSGGNTTITQGTVDGTSQFNATDNLTLTTFTGGNNLTAQAGGTINFGTVTLTNGSLRANAGSDLDVTQQLNVQNGNAALTAGTNVAATDITASGDVDIQAGGTVQTTQVQAGRDINVNAGGDVSMYSSNAGNDMSVSSGGALTIHDAQAGNAMSLAAQQMTFDNVHAPNSITLLARDGNIIAKELTTKDAYAEANGDIVLDAGYIGDRINLQANNITANLTQTSKGQPLYSVFSGYQGGVANRITVDANASQEWMIDRLAAVQAALITTAPNANIASGRIMKTMSLDTSKATVRMNQQSALLVAADVQLMQPTYDFMLDQDGNHTLTNAFVIRYSYGYEIQTPNYVDTHVSLDPDYLGESALRNNGRFLDQEDQSDDSELQQKRAIPAWIATDKADLVQPASSEQPSVNIRAPE